jgi:2-iminobutanoate/2-iminopropanoate deaminase
MSTFGPYTPIRQAGDLYFVSGQIGVDDKTKQAGISVEDQTHQAIKNLEKVLKTSNLSLGNVVKTTVFLQSMDYYSTVNDIYMAYFAGVPPARSCIEVSALPRVGESTILIEIEAVAYKAL